MKIITTGEDTIDRIISKYYGDSNEKNIRAKIEQVNPGVALSSLQVGQVLELPDLAAQPDQDLTRE